MNARRYLPTLAELIDRLSIVQLKEIFISEHRSEYSREIEDLLHDIGLCLDGRGTAAGEGTGSGEGAAGPVVTAETIRDIVVLAQMNLHIWHNEANCRRGIKDGNDLELSHSLNGVRNLAKNRIQARVGGRQDHKVDCLAEDAGRWMPSGW
ncbi:MAG: hypothetical protein MUC56_15740 [Thermoanaerobaculales bacterium]|jgi:hypothetical protein|nr:hypothetical protein [Thermoanaerobaculales bacterium]